MRNPIASYIFRNHFLAALFVLLIGWILYQIREILIIIFISFKTDVSIVPIFAGYSIGYLFRIISPTPQGIGIVEGVMPYVFGTFGIDIALATIVTLIYRGISIWLPALIGFVTFNLITKKYKGEENGESRTTIS